MLTLRRSKLAMYLSVALAGAAAFECPLLYAQDATQQSATQRNKSTATNLQEVEVTGTRIKGADMATQVPVEVISAQQIQESGLTSIGDVLQQLTSAGGGISTKLNRAGGVGFPASGAGAGAGASTLDLRNLGSNRVLILVDGKRWVNESSSSGVSGSVDLNTIPIGAIERIEILKDGASALYGSDAIAGVVNIITKTSQQGVSATYYAGTYNNLGNNGTTQHADISFGAHSDKDQLFVNLGYFRQEAISSSEWSVSSQCTPETSLATCSGQSPYGRYRFIDPNGVTQDITLNRDFTGAHPSYPNDFHKFTSADRYNYGPVQLLLTPNERSSVFFNNNYQVSSSLNWYTRGLYNNRRSLNTSAAEGFGLGPAAGDSAGYTSGVDVSNPYNPFGFTLDPATNLIGINKRPIEGGLRLFRQNVNTTYLATGLDGSFQLGGRKYSWDVNLVRGDNYATQVHTGSYNALNIKNSLGPVSVCDSIQANGTGCVPFNIFGSPGSITPDQLGYVQYVDQASSENKLLDWSANISGEVIDLPAGPLGVAVGVDHRRYSGYFEPSATLASGFSDDGFAGPTSGSYSINEAYGELSVPLLREIPGIEALDLSLASRYSNYSTFGSTTNSKVGLRWQMLKDLTLRGTWAEGFRAPSIGELFGSLSHSAPTILDPCSADTITPENVSKCASLGVPATYVNPGTQTNTTVGGNPNLQPETSTSTTLGVVYSPTWALSPWTSRLDITLGYYHVMLNGAVGAPDAQTMLNRCVASGDAGSIACSGISRDKAGNIFDFLDTLENLGTINTSGYSFDVDWRTPETGIGAFNANLSATYVANYTQTSPDGGIEPGIVGIEVNDGGVPRLSTNLSLGWQHQAWSVSTMLRYTSALNEDCGAAVGFPVCNANLITPQRPDGTHHLGAVTYQDLRASWKVPVNLNLTLTLGVRNIWNKAPPICVSCSLNGYDPANYDLPSRFTYVQANVTF